MSSHVPSINGLCISLFLNLLNFSCCYFYCYKQPIVSTKQPIVFLVLYYFELCSWETEFLNLFSCKEFHSILKSLQKPPLNHSPPSSLKPYILTIGIKSFVLEKYSSWSKNLFQWLENYLLRKVHQLTNHLCFVV